MVKFIAGKADESDEPTRIYVDDKDGTARVLARRLGADVVIGWFTAGVFRRNCISRESAVKLGLAVNDDGQIIFT